MKNNDYVTIASVDVVVGSYWYEKIVEALKKEGFTISQSPTSSYFDILINHNKYYAGGSKYDSE